MAKATEKALKKKDERGIEKIGGIPVDAIERMEAVVGEYGIESITTSKGNTFGPMLRMAEGIVRLRELLTADVMKAVMVLRGSQLGFLTDKDRSGGYDVQTVRDVFIEAVLLGARPIGNEFNIISGKAYLTLNNFRRKIREYPGLTDLEISWGLKAIEVKPGTSIDVPYTAKWKLNGADMSVKGTIPVRVNQSMGADAVLGKTHRKVLNLIYQKITGSEHTLPEGDVTDLDLPAAVETTAKDVLAPGRHKVGKKAPPPEEKTKQSEFTVTGALAYDVEQAALGNDWTMEAMHWYILDRYTTTLKELTSEAVYVEILKHFTTKGPEAEGANDE